MAQTLSANNLMVDRVGDIHDLPLVSRLDGDDFIHLSSIWYLTAREPQSVHISLIFVILFYHILHHMLHHMLHLEAHHYIKTK